MSTSSVRIFGCPTCGFRVDTNEESCPRCGNEFKKETKFECPFCGDLVASGLDECPSCHISYSEFKARAAPKAAGESIDSLLMEIIKLESTSVKEEDRRFSCPQCDLLLEGTEAMCPRCHKKLDVDVALQCPVCGGLVGANDVRCGECGTVFDAEADSAARTEEAESKLEEIMSMAGPEEEPAEPEKPSVAVQAESPKAKERNDGIEFASAMFGKLKEAVRIEPEKKAPPPPPPKRPVFEEPAPEPVASEPPPAAPEEPTPEEPFQEVEQPEPEEPVPAAATAAPKKASAGASKKRTRKLKAKQKA